MDFDSTGNLTLLNGCIPGDGLQNRQGRQIAMQSVTLRALIKKDKAGSAPKADFLRLVLFYDRQPNAVAPTAVNVLYQTDNAGTGSQSAMSGPNLSNSSRFHILRDWHWPICDADMFATGNSASSLLQAAPSAGLKCFVNLKGLETHFNAGTAGTIADITSGALYLLALGQNANADSQFAVDFVSRVRFTE